jgi:hypothetical protein
LYGKKGRKKIPQYFCAHFFPENVMKKEMNLINPDIKDIKAIAFVH